MSLRGRLLVLIVLMNLLVLGVIHVTVAALRDRWMERETKTFLDALHQVDGYLLPAGTSLDISSIEAADTVRRILGRHDFRSKFKDILISQADAFGKVVDINPLGVMSRDHRTFPIDAIRKGIEHAKRDDTPVEVAGGRCVAIKSEAGAVEGGAWFVPLLPSAPQLSLLAYALPVLLGIVVISLLASFIISRTLGWPMDQLGGAARRFARGDYAARVPKMDSAPELETLVDAFNAMATKVEGHTAELSREVERATEAAAAKERALLVSSRLAAMGTLAAGIAHEVNNPIGGMLNAVHRLAQGDGLTDQERRYLDLIQQGLSRVARTSRKLLDFTPRLLEPVEFPIGEAVEGARSLVEHRLLRQGVTFAVEIEKSLPAVVGEPHEIQQVLLNLFLNSLNAMSDRPDSHITVRGHHVDDRVELEVADDGPGVDAETLGQVMDPFFSGSNAPDSSGLGLFICYTIIQNHAGKMWMESTPGRGFIVHLSLPAAGAPRAGATDPGVDDGAEL